MKTIVIDFDGVIHRYSLGWRDGTIYDAPVEGALEGLMNLIRADYAVVICSTREAPQIVSWLNALGHPGLVAREMRADQKFWDVRGVVGVTNRKVAGIAYIDDRGIRFTNWRDMLAYFA
jgi:hypothetical protein